MQRDGASKVMAKHMPGFTSKKISVAVKYMMCNSSGGITGMATGLLLQKSGKKCFIAEAGHWLWNYRRTTAHLIRSWIVLILN